MNRLNAIFRADNRADARGTATGQRLLVAATVSVLVLFGGPAPAQSQNLRGLPDLVERLLPSVVNIDTTKVVDRRRSTPNLPEGSPLEEFFRQFGQEGPRRSTSGGSGFVIAEDGFIVTNNHVIEDADNIEVVLADERRIPATVVGTDVRTDLALLKIDVDEPLSALTWGDSRSLRVGEQVVAIGNPFGLGGTVTTGIISALQRNINNEVLQSFIQTDAAINPGNSGGPLFNLSGEVVGVNTAIFSRGGGSIGLGFSIPSETAQRVITQLHDFGRARRGWLGVRIQDVDDDLAAELGLDRPRGALVSAVEPDSPAEEGKLSEGDVILRFAGASIDERPDLQRFVAATEIGSTVPIEVWRDGQLVSLDITIGEFPEAELRNASTGPGVPDFEGDGNVDTLGLGLRPIDDELRQQFDIDSETGGLLVTSVTPGGPSASTGLRSGDIILEVNQQPVASVADIQDAIDRTRSSGRPTILMMVQEPDGERRFVVVPIGRG